MISKENKRFELVKKHHTQTLLNAIDQEVVDAVLIPFLFEVTKLKNIFTSSSCAGRIMLLSTDELENKKNSYFHKRYHRQVSFDEIKKDIDNFLGKDLWFKMEPFIFHFGCKDMHVAKSILKFSQDFGFKKSGIISMKPGRFTVEISNTQYMALPLIIDCVKLFEDKSLKLIIDKANKKIEYNFERLEKFSKSFLERFSNHFANLAFETQQDSLPKS